MYGLPDSAVLGTAKRLKGAGRKRGRGRALTKAEKDFANALALWICQRIDKKK
jgi:hypothetical protein